MPVKSASALAPKFCPSCRGTFPTEALFCPNDGSPLTTTRPPDEDEAMAAAPDPYLGREISGHIEIRQLAGVGAMGRVYRAFQKGIDRDVAAKILHRELSANQQLVSRFHREAKVASRLQHPNVVHVHLAGQLPDGALYIVMEFLDGLSLQSALAAAGGAMPLTRALHIALQLCDAVGEAHTQGIVHRDLKPENVMLVRRGQDDDYVKVLDFGIARLNWGEQSMATAAGLIFGTARYISPEGAQGEAVGPTGDVYAIATLLYQMLCGRTPFEGDQAVGLLIQQIHDPPPPLKSIPRGAYVPDPLAAAIMKNLAKESHLRDPDARTFGRAIIDATKESGLSLDDFVARSTLGSRPSGSIKLAPLERTKALQLDVELSTRLNASPALPKTEITEPRVLKTEAGAPLGSEGGRVQYPAAPTTKWTPSPEFQAQIGAARPSTPSQVDATMDDASATPPPPARPSNTQLTPPVQSTAPLLPRVVLPSPGAFPPPSREAPTTPPLSQASPQTGESSPQRIATPTPKPLSNVDTTLSDVVPPTRRARALALIVFCFLIGVIGTTAAALKLGFLGPPNPAVLLEDQVARATDALRHERWDTPPGDNVRDLTADGLTKWPGDPRLMDIRARATDDLVKKAVGLKMAGDLHGAIHLSRLASELDPTDETARVIAHEYESEAVRAADASSLLFLDDAGAGVSVVRPSQQNFGARAVIDASPSRPKLGQSVEFAAKVVSASGGAPRSVVEAHFAIVGPGLGAGAKLAAMSEGANYRTGFTFLEQGKYEIVFSAKVDGASVRAQKIVVVGDPGPPRPEPSGDTPTTVPSAKWL
jgi:serine/threonine protein kinase